MTDHITKDSEFFERVLPFLEQVGIPVQLESFEFESFLPGVGLHKGQLWIDLAQLTAPGDVLHEAGHYAVTQTDKRAQVDQQVLKDNDQLEGEEMAAMLWSYAVAVHLELPPSMVFHQKGYKGQADWILQRYAEGDFFGLPLLQFFGMAYYPDEGPSFPKMKQWLRA
ncbi:hypothetical protein [Gilvibacter sediminis]|uniref:hypothetical protein n=1 Tax=Gilvibacter sediminis TaxID=379071 RepID=UPI002350D4F1|nr:hypothetical protein [Gilvibacter sediminis]MDC7997313.1 hypothetical protein [Gilvibacter sediminis]